MKLRGVLWLVMVGKRGITKKQLSLEALSLLSSSQALPFTFSFKINIKMKNALAAAETFTSNIAKEKYDKLGSSVSNESLKK